jgi:hypothetical protein
MSLRSLAQATDLDAGYLSKVERGLLAPPQQPAVISRLAAGLALAHDATVRLRDLASLSDGRLPPDLAADNRIMGLLPILSAALRDVLAHFDQVTDPTATGDSAATPAALQGWTYQLARTLEAAASHIGPTLSSSAKWEATAAASAEKVAATRVRKRHARDVYNVAVTTCQTTREGARERRDAARLQRSFNRLLAEHIAMRRIVDAIRVAGGRAVVFGGWPRDHIASRCLRRPIEPADVDLVVDGVAPDHLHKILLGLEIGPVRRNAFDGFVLETLAGLKMDLWSLETTYTFVKRQEQPSFEALPETTVFTIESVVFKPAQWWGTPSLIECGFYDALERREIDLQRGERPFPTFQVGRALQYAQKLDFNLSPAVLEFANQTLASQGAASEVRSGVRQFGHPRYRRQVLRDLRKLQVALGRDAVAAESRR